MPYFRALTKTLSDAVRIQLQGYEVGEVLDRVTEDAAKVLEVAGTGVALADANSALRFVTATDERVVQMEMWQESHQQGPCQDAYHGGQRVMATDLEGDHRWGEFGSAALAIGIRGAASLPMATDGARLGAMTVYSEQPREWTEELLEAAQVLADLATLYIVKQRQLDASATLAEQLQHALDSRVIIEQAKGVIAERKGTDPATAFGYLRRHARNTRTSLHKVAQAVVTGDLDVPGHPPG